MARSKTTITSIEEAWMIWRECLEGDDTNSIMRQLVQMTWDAAIFHMVYESRKATIRQNPDNPRINPYFYQFLDRCFFESQAIAIRRVIDKSPISGNRGVYSLRALLNDINAHRQDLTRDVYIRLRMRQNPEWDSFSAAESHRLFDQLSNKDRGTRQPDDLICECFFSGLEEKIKVTSRSVKRYVDRFIAHSATPGSREGDGEKTQVTLGEIWKAQEIVAEITEFLLTFLFSKEWVLLPPIPAAVYENWDAPIYNGENHYLLEQVLQEYREETEKWRLNSFKDVMTWVDIPGSNTL